MFELDGKCTIGMDLAALSKNPTGIALLKGKEAETSLVYTDEEILRYITRNATLLISICPVKPSKKRQNSQKSTQRNGKKGLPCIPSNFPRDENTYLTRKKIE